MTMKRGGVVIEARRATDGWVSLWIQVCRGGDLDNDGYGDRITPIQTSVNTKDRANKIL